MTHAINLDFELKDLDGKPVGGQHVGEAVAVTLASLTVGNTIKLYDWAVSLHKREALRLDTADAKMFRDLVENKLNLSILCKRQILAVLDMSLQQQ